MYRFIAGSVHIGVKSSSYASRIGLTDLMPDPESESRIARVYEEIRKRIGVDVIKESNVQLELKKRREVESALALRSKGVRAIEIVINQWNPPQLGRSVSIDQAGKLLQISRRTVYNRIRDGRLRTVRTLGGSQRVLVKSLYDEGFKPQPHSASLLR